MPDENKSYAFITDTEGYIYCYDSENEELYTTHPLAMEAIQYKQ
mgnify:CR=1 FL=1